MELKERIARIIKGDAADDDATLKQYSHDTSIFERRPSVVVFPKSTEDVAAIVRFAQERKMAGENVSIAPRSAGTDMTGGDLTDSISMVFTKYMNKVYEVANDTSTQASGDTGYAVAEPGIYYRDLEKETLSKIGKKVASYPASRNLCALGGMISNNCGGELTLRYGKMNKHVRELEVVLSDGSVATMRPLTLAELEVKKKEQTLEGEIYREIHALIEANWDAIQAAKPNVTKNSAGYALWDVLDKEKGTFDLTQLIAGSQGTLGIVTKAKVGLVETKKHKAMLVAFISDLEVLPEIVGRVLKFGPESFESYDDQALKMAVRFIPQFLRQMGPIRAITLGLSFIPEAFLVLTGGKLPKLIIMAEFAEDSADEAYEKVKSARAALEGLPTKTKMARSEIQASKYWTIRREAFALLRKKLPGLSAASFIDDLVVHPNDYPKFIPELNALLMKYHFIFTIQGHIGDANFHVFPLINLGSAEDRKIVLDLGPKVFELVAKYKGSITGEHNDGIVRTPFLSMMYGERMVHLFAQVKKAFDPHNVLNPGKKTGGTIEDIEKYMITHQ